MKRYNTKLLSYLSDEQIKKIESDDNIIEFYKFAFLKENNKKDELTINIVKKIKSGIAGICYDDAIYIEDGFDKETFDNIIKHELVHWMFIKYKLNNKKNSHLYNEEEIACIIADIYDNYSQALNYILAFIGGKKKICN